MTVEEKNLEWYRSLPAWRAGDIRAFMDLPEYSATNPTGVRVGKMWRRHNGVYDAAFIKAGGKPKWVVCRYEEAPDGYIMTNWLMTEMGIPKRITDCTAAENAKSRRIYTRQAMCKTAMYRPVIVVRGPIASIPCSTCDMPDLCKAECHCDQSYNGYR